MQLISNLFLLTILVFIFNLPFGYWRYNVRKLSKQWFLAVHIPVPFIVLARIYMNIGFHWTSYVFLIGAFFIGQFIGGVIYKYRKRHREVSSCLVMDSFKK